MDWVKGIVTIWGGPFGSRYSLVFRGSLGCFSLASLPDPMEPEHSPKKLRKSPRPAFGKVCPAYPQNESERGINGYSAFLLFNLSATAIATATSQA